MQSLAMPSRCFVVKLHGWGVLRPSDISGSFLFILYINFTPDGVICQGIFSLSDHFFKQKSYFILSVNCDACFLQHFSRNAVA